MQFHHHGYVSGDPRIAPAAGVGLDRPEELPSEIDVLIVGSGPAGIVAAAQLAQFPNVVTRVVERRDGRLVLGQADGIQARSVETFQAFGFAQQIIQEAYQITETSFWTPDPEQPSNIVHSSTTPDDPHGISEFPHLIVNQARVIDYFADYARRAPARGDIDYGTEFVDLEVGEGEYPVTVTLRRVSGFSGAGINTEKAAGDGVESEITVRAKYVIGADGARSAVRRSIGGSLAGSTSLHAWGVMDVLAVTDFPDFRKKCIIHSEAGSILHIPREGNHLARIYVDLGETDENDGGQVRNTPLDEVIARANAIIHPYTLDVRDVPWHSVYEVAHRLTDRFDDAASSPDGKGRVFLMGDACHTHSAKAGQGMNVSMQDGWNLGWKLGYVLEGRSPESLLKTYSDERWVTSKNLIDFDREWSTLMAKKPEEFDSPSELEDFYVATAEFPAGFMTQYTESMLTGNAEYQELASGFPLGKRFKSVMTTRVADAVPVHLGHHHRADGRFRVYAFADASGERLERWAQWMLEDPASPVRRFTPEGADLDALLDVKAVYQQAHDQVGLAAVPKLFLPASGPFGLTDYEKVYAAQPGDGDIFELRGIDRDGAVVVVRPDHYVAAVLPLDAPELVADYFAGVLLER
ncbi:phenol 2-monooxygenase [Leucobacter sp. OLJS4]|uniref:FAD-dependent monooxygenase n=1 Tax=unclassified Leucobacter TaxID=2621730 RepID=UPI000C19E92A|nr:MULTISPECIES: FAD-dependent monooxygenase [unclassified Leucobacter]PIJ51480.1 phenol 2-monooxygenase [Leucobacter sp. OLES1]PII83314.1 phenol 2-monooxygenase [Leucobacter sp. OLCALW19]PII86865.1 phenol 2-monooxygenase [Leucobacter sp. OLTLW20]PII91199.1 phenol 2-monooxygenase [Leucobacter sp. OLAS13]PII98658.1 phenol 2-monooxygenase [Leucobacter sp. OLDS2]